MGIPPVVFPPPVVPAPPPEVPADVPLEEDVVTPEPPEEAPEVCVLPLPPEETPPVPVDERPAEDPPEAAEPLDPEAVVTLPPPVAPASKNWTAPLLWQAPARRASVETSSDRSVPPQRRQG
jgi:protein TonB